MAGQPAFQYPVHFTCKGCYRIVVLVSQYRSMGDDYVGLFKGVENVVKMDDSDLVFGGGKVKAKINCTCGLALGFKILHAEKNEKELIGSFILEWDKLRYTRGGQTYTPEYVETPEDKVFGKQFGYDVRTIEKYLS